MEFDPEFVRTDSLWVVCRAAASEVREGVWEECAGELRKHMEDLEYTTGRRRFGAVAMGKIVRFCEYADGVVVYLDGDSTAFHARRQCRTIQGKWNMLGITIEGKYKGAGLCGPICNGIH